MDKNEANMILNEDGEVVVQLADGWTLRSGSASHYYVSGEYVRLVRPDGDDYLYWDSDEWRIDPVLVMGAIINSAAGLRLDLGLIDQLGGDVVEQHNDKES